ncbi:vancomycin resistance protein YoaR [Neobacillus bataviensis]|uniref:Vancomycin resistance protein YoaR n=1 Tax=Neobacillus bataviensis TaxID=220685 RepID=A0A561DEC5_9BACI|nr:VanW family protein [Neobacillus bataviensis]TWE01740.1 vancomycin resistance protein YoaR [Neobacillus bataviensis]
MVKRRWVISVLLIGSLLGLAGCTEKAATKKPDHEKEKVTESQKQPVQKPQEQPQKEKEKKPVVVNVMDPKTKSIVETFLPEELGYASNPDSYKQEIEQWARDLARGTDKTAGYDQRMVLDKIDANGQIIKGKPLIILDEAELVNRVMTASAMGGDVELPITITASGYKPEDTAHLNEVVVGSFTTYFNSGVVGRSKNIELSAMAINNVIVGTGDIFSFNTTVGPSDASHGYQPAKEIVNKKMVMGIGGGICQTSSTLFNAVDQVGVSYVEKHHHSLSVGYVPQGRDATVSYGGPDFRFKNTTGGPFLIKTIYAKGKVTVEIRTSAAYQSLIKK